MTPDEFRSLALSMPEAEEAYRSGSSEFRVGRKIFARLEGPADSVATILLSSEQQAVFVNLAPRVFTQPAGGWGRLGVTNVVLDVAGSDLVRNCLQAAWRNVAPRSLREQENDQSES
jgi:hypothetical protein